MHFLIFALFTALNSSLEPKRYSPEPLAKNTPDLLQNKPCQSKNSFFLGDATFSTNRDDNESIEER